MHTSFKFFLLMSLISTRIYFRIHHFCKIMYLDSGIFHRPCILKFIGLPCTYIRFCNKDSMNFLSFHSVNSLTTWCRSLNSQYCLKLRFKRSSRFSTSTVIVVLNYDVNKIIIDNAFRYGVAISLQFSKNYCLTLLKISFART